MASTPHDAEFAERLRSLRFDELPDYLTISEAATYLRKKVKTLYDWRLNGIGPQAIRVGGSLMYPREQIGAWLEAEKLKQLVAS